MIGNSKYNQRPQRGDNLVGRCCVIYANPSSMRMLERTPIKGASGIDSYGSGRHGMPLSTA